MKANLRFIGLIIVLISLVMARFGLTWLTLYGCILTGILLILSAIDWQYQYLPDNLTLSLLWLGLFVNLHSFYVALDDAVLGAIIGYLSMKLLATSFYVCTGRVGLGQGDWKLFAALGAWFGWQSLPQILAEASFSGCIIAVIMMLKGKWQKHEPIPFGPFLAISGWVSLFTF